MHKTQKEAMVNTNCIQCYHMLLTNLLTNPIVYKLHIYRWLGKYLSTKLAFMKLANARRAWIYAAKFLFFKDVGSISYIP